MGHGIGWVIYLLWSAGKYPYCLAGVFPSRGSPFTSAVIHTHRSSVYHSASMDTALGWVPAPLKTGSEFSFDQAAADIPSANVLAGLPQLKHSLLEFLFFQRGCKTSFKAMARVTP